MLVCAAMVCAAQAPASDAAPKPIVSLDLTAIDKSIDPCVDFYKYSCGNWMKNNPVPPDKSRWGRFDGLSEQNLYVMRDLLVQAQAPGKHTATEKKVGTFYASCMDEATIETKGVAPLQPQLARIDAITSKAQLVKQVAYMHQHAMPAIFAFYGQPDMHDSNATIAYIDQGGLSLPDRDYYIKDDAKSTETRQEYLKHVQKMFELAGDKPEVAAAEAKTVLTVETGLAQASMDRTERRDPKKRDHKMTVAEITAAAPNFDLAAYFASNGSPKFSSLNVGNPEFFKQVNAQLDTISLADWKTYLRWKTINSNAPLLTKAFVEEDFLFNGKYMSGQQQQEPRWKRCVKTTDATLGMALGQLYVDKMFGAAGKERTLKMVSAIEKAMKQDIADLSWMSDTTKKQAYEKLNTIVNNIGYPDQWRDYSSVTVVSDDYAGNVARASAVRSAAPVQQDRQAYRPQRLEHDSADRERLLPAADERHQLPGRNSPAAVLCSFDGRRRELWRDWRGHRPRTHAWI